MTLTVDLEKGSNTVSIPANRIQSANISLEHTAISGWKIVVAPEDTGLRDYHLGTAKIYTDGNLLISGELQRTPQSGGTITLDGVGPAHQLRHDTTHAVYSNIPVWKAVDDYKSNTPATTWTVHEAFVNDKDVDKTVMDIPSLHDFDQFATGVSNTDPVDVDPGTDIKVELLQTSWFADAEDQSFTGSVVSGSSYSDGEAVELSSEGHGVTEGFTPDYNIPSDEINIRYRAEFDNLKADVILKLDDTEVRRSSFGGATDSLDWHGVISDANEPSSDLDTNPHTARVELRNYKEGTNDEEAVSGSLTVDVLNPRDELTRFFGGTNISGDYTEDNTVDSETLALDGPEEYPSQIDVRLEATTEVWHVRKMDVTSTWDDTSNNQAIRLSTTGNSAEFIQHNNTTSASTNFDDQDIWGFSLIVELRLSRYTSDSTTSPATGDSGQTVTELTLDVTTDDLPIIGSSGLTLDADSHFENMQTLHGEGQMRFVVDHRDPDLVVESFRTGDQTLLQTQDWTTDGADAVTRERDTADYFNEVTVYPDPSASGVSATTVRDTDEETRVGVRESRARQTDATTTSEVNQEARKALREGTAADRFSGSIQIVASYVAPGYPYQPTEFDGDQSNLERVSITKDGTAVTGSLSFGARRDLVAAIQRRTV